jgi:hypothetical protein
MPHDINDSAMTVARDSPATHYDFSFTCCLAIADKQSTRRANRTQTNSRSANYSPVSNIGDIRSLEEGSDEGSIVLDIDEVGLDAFLQQFI